MSIFSWSWLLPLCSLIDNSCGWYSYIYCEPYARLDIFLLLHQTRFQLFFHRDLHLPKVLRPDTLMGIVKGEGRRGRCLRVKVAVGFKLLLIKFWSGNHRLLGLLCKGQSGTGTQETSLQQWNSGTWCSERPGRWKWWGVAAQTTFQGSRQPFIQVAR